MGGLYKVEVRYVMMVLADTKEEAEREACNAIKIGDDPEEELWAEKVTSKDDVPAEWLDSIPWGKPRNNPDSLTVQQLLGGKLCENK